MRPTKPGVVSELMVNGSKKPDLAGHGVAPGELFFVIARKHSGLDGLLGHIGPNVGQKQHPLARRWENAASHPAPSIAAD